MKNGTVIPSVIRRGRRILLGPEAFVLTSLLVFGLAACFLVPYGAGFDEETHLLRLWELSGLHFVPNERLRQGLPYPAIFWDLSYRRQVLIRPVDPDFWEKYGSLTLDAHDYLYSPPLTRSVYSPPLLAPQALAMRYLGRRFLDQGRSLPALTVFYACRIAGLLSYLVLAWLAVRVVPYGKWVMALAAASPMALFQAATINADAVSNGIGLLFLGGCLAISQRQRLRWREWGTLAFLALLLFLAKVNLTIMAILPLVLLPPSRFTMRRGHTLLLVVIAVMFVVEVGGWNLIAYSAYGGALQGAEPVGQLRHMVSQPAAFLVALARTLIEHGDDFLREWVGVYGYGYWAVPSIMYLLYALGIAGALVVVVPGEVVATKRDRVALALTFGLTALATLGVLYVTYTPVGSGEVEGVQGRYLTPVMPMFLLSAAGLLGKRELPWRRVLAPVGGGGALLAYMVGLVLSYHVPCGTQYYRTGLCYQPVYKNWAPNASYSAPVVGDMVLRQEIVPECSGLAAVRLWIDASGASQGALTRFTLRDTLRNRNPVDMEIAASDLPSGGWVELPFDPDWESGGKVYYLTVRAGSQPGQSGPRVAFTLRPEYTDGRLYEGDQPMDVDMVFQYGCVAGLEMIRRGYWP